MSTFSRSNGVKFRVQTPLRDVLVTTLTRCRGERPTHLQELVDKLIDQAKTGDWMAMKEIFDRLDGRPDATGVAEQESGPRLLVTGIRPPSERDGDAPAGPNGRGNM